MADKVAVLDPEPITLLDTEDEPGISQSRRSSIANSNFYIERAFVTNCTIISGERSTPKFAVWKVTAVLHPLNPNSSGSYRIHTYRRYSDFVEFRNALLDRVRTKRPTSVSEIPELPPPVKWYYSWKYNEINLNREWLANRRKGLELFINQVLLNGNIVDIAKDLVIQFLRPRK
ncbi:PX domain-containing protein YPT35 [Nakaseomyces glabratus]|uniref:Endosomal/vacuolar adapter protein YPT35 n=1 Tax=Candida glabrata TaxID=5478 RepID=A0A0W0CP65_CANGB|nr:PX domain profile [Nakaseomyces glabratus]KAH7587302.1 PX domain profile [Nakaseomyces glabratus]KTB01380.1 PX domain-containing protein YPT35 [Nakaseomyces glabratus]KTB05491.1 PX domain-containing protein YPT35 [Nakaseomyces glabratus]KTB05715.1 PX domain-containing protein YPT35 [Nakaseomyces glabratus]